MNKQKNYRRRQRGITPITTPRNSPGVAQFSMSEVAQFSVSLDRLQRCVGVSLRSDQSAPYWADESESSF
ncbi:MAG: hypothetical protein NWR31_07785, partial [Cyanobium sp. MAG_160]|nr:hypothetical protein [Cyanobium sp. MAG_160]